MQTVKVVAAGVLVALALTGCSSSDGKGKGGGDLERGPAANAAELRIRFDEQLGEHAILGVAALQDMVNQQPTAAPELALLVGKNAKDLGATFGAAFGAANGDQFKEQLNNQVGILVRYAVAKGAGDLHAASAALHDLDGSQARFAGFMAAVVPSLSRQAVAAEARQRLRGMVAAVDASVAHRQPQAASRFADAYEQMFVTGAELAGAAGGSGAAPRGGALDASPADLRATLDLQLGEEAALTALVLRKAVSGAPDGKAFGAQLAEATQGLAQTIASVYGQPAGSRFKTLWNGQLAALLDGTSARATHDTARLQRAKAALAGFADRLAAFLAGVNPNLSRAVLSGLLTTQVTQALATVDAAYAGNPVASTNSLVAAYEHAFALGGTLGTAIAKQFPDRFATQR